MSRAVKRSVVGLVVLLVAAAVVVLAVRAAPDGATTASADPPASASASAAPAPSTASAGGGSGPTSAAPVGTEQLEPPPGAPVATEAPVVTDGSRVVVVLTFLGWDEQAGAADAAGYVDGVVEDGGTCTLTLVRGAQTVTAEVPGEADASTTVCGGFQVRAGSLAPGNWQATLTYASDRTVGTSGERVLEVPAA